MKFVTEYEKNHAGRLWVCYPVLHPARRCYGFQDDFGNLVVF